jgi:hypothetical protein
MYFSNLYDFKGASRAIKRGLSSLPQGSRITPENLMPILIEIPQIQTKEQLLKLSQKLAPAFNLARSPSINLTETQRILAKYTMGMPYEAMAAEISKDPLDFYEIFQPPSNLNLSGSPRLMKRNIVHPFPKEIFELKVLRKWKPEWELLGRSTNKTTFFPPLPPFSCFPKKKLHLKAYNNWQQRLSQNPHEKIQNGEAGVLVLDQDNHIVAAANWGFWGNWEHLSGNDFSLSIKLNDKILWLGFDIRPYEEYPTCGPTIKRIP